MKVMISVYRPRGFDFASIDEAGMMADIDALNDEMVAAGIRVFVGGLQPVSSAVALRPGGEGEWVEEQGSLVETGEVLDGFWVLEVADMDEAIAWGRKAASACRAGIEVRAFH